MLLANILLSISAFTALLLGLFIIASNPKRPLNRSFLFFTSSAFIWLIANLLTNLARNPSTSLLYARTTLVGASLLPYAFIIFCKIYTRDKRFNSKQAITLAIPPMVLLLSVPTRLNIVSVSSYGQNTVTGSIYFLLIAVLLTYFGWGLALLVKLYRKTTNAAEKARLSYIFLGIILSLIPGALTNAILPTLGNSHAYLYGPNTIMIFVVFTAVAIVRHRLLDIRLLVARSVAYGLTITSLAGLFTLITFVIINLLFGSNHLSDAIVRLLYTVLAVVLALLFPWLRKFFNKVSSRVFYRDAYDTQAFLDEFNKVLVSTYALDQLLKKSAEIIEENIKPTRCLFVINETENTKSRLVSSGSKSDIAKQDVDDIKNALSRTRQNLIVADELEDKHESLQQLLRSKDIVLAAKLAASTSGSRLEVGYLMLGPKKSGNLYSAQDLKVVEIIANELVIAAQNALRFEEITNFNVTLQGRVDDATRKLRRANEKLKALDETKDDFISMASHQLRTPLTSVKGYISMVLEQDAGKITHMQREMLGQAFFSSQRMVYLIADLLNVSRLRTGKFIIETTPVNLAEVVEQELEQLKETAAARSLVLSYKKPKHFPDLMLDETKSRQVIMNFADNAIYYTPSGGHITVRLVDTPTVVELRVEDDGIGVPKSEQAHLFTKFYRAGNARKARPDGTGLGLFMAKKVVIAQGGALIFESQEGKGSIFGFVFSKAKLAVPPAGSKAKPE